MVTTYVVRVAIMLVALLSVLAAVATAQNVTYTVPLHTGQWVYNPECLRRCNIRLPANLVDAGTPAVAG